MINRYLIWILVTCASPFVHAAKPPAESWTFSFRLENDLFNSTDRLYTNGIKLNWISPDLDWFEDLPWMKKDGVAQQRVRDLISVLPYREDSTRQHNFSISLGQMLFTPGDTTTRNLIVDDRPYAGWLYGALAFHSKNYRVLDTFELQAGLTGDWSLGEQTQDLIHSIRDISRANGWDNQIDTEFGVALVYERKYRLVPHLKFSRHWGADAILHAGGAVGTVYTYINSGLELRAGWNLPMDFGSALIRPAGDTNAPTDTRDVRYRDREAYSAHVFAALSGRMVVRDIFLDGNTFSDSHSVDKQTFVGDFVLGFSLVYRRLKVSYAQVLRTQEFKKQADGHDFGSISISYTF